MMADNASTTDWLAMMIDEQHFVDKTPLVWNHGIL